MGKLISVWGAPGSGKTSFSVKLASALCKGRDQSNSAVIVIFTDIISPVMPILFPNYRSQDLFSLGTVLSKPDISPYDVVSNMVTVRSAANLGFLGYRANENKFSFPEYNEEKAAMFYDMVCSMADYVIVDCMSMPEDNLLTKVALERADQMIRLSSPDLKCLSFTMSQLPIFLSNGYVKENQIQIMNTPNQDLAMPVSDISAHLGNILCTVPYSLALVQQAMEGNMTDPLKDKRYTQVMRMIAERLR